MKKKLAIYLIILFGNTALNSCNAEELNIDVSASSPPDILIQELESNPRLQSFTGAFRNFKMSASEWNKGVTLFVPQDNELVDYEFTDSDIKNHLISGLITKDALSGKTSLSTIGGEIIPVEAWTGDVYAVRANGVGFIDESYSSNQEGKFCLYSVERPLFSVPGSIVAYSAPSTGRYIGDPCMFVLADGTYLASHDFFGATYGVSRIYSSNDKGRTWILISELHGIQVASFFVINDDLYFMGLDRTGQVVIRKSFDDGLNCANGLFWTTPTNSQNGILRTGVYQTAAAPVVIHNGRVWKTVEKVTGPLSGWAKSFEALMMSAPVGANLLDAASWIESVMTPYNSSYLGGRFEGMLEGCAVLGTDNHVYNMLRVHTNIAGKEYAAKIKTSSDGTTVTFNESSDLVLFPGGSKKFTVIYDEESNRYWTLSNAVAPSLRNQTSTPKFRNTLALCSSPDMTNWTVHKIILNHPNVDISGFQYVDFKIDNNDIVAIVRTSFDDGVQAPPNFHDANYLLFLNIEDFRQYKNVVYPY